MLEAELTLQSVFGKDVFTTEGFVDKRNKARVTHPALRGVQQHDTIRVLYARLKNGTRCYTDNPVKADLFLIPIFVMGPSKKENFVVDLAAEKCRGKADELVAAL
eukprot:2625791-Amphidinium_carterae.1